ncbi:hypothetical protein [Flaviaesturariibacter amylovorans]|uniref:Uncharacterized protein n=1 Tax=Flaviaesturariibacter amylovorans TaxID=1084520 RepID=A0ABP8GKM0_9BACT
MKQSTEPNPIHIPIRYKLLRGWYSIIDLIANPILHLQVWIASKEHKKPKSITNVEESK